MELTNEQIQWLFEQCGLVFKNEVGYHGWYRGIGISGLEKVFVPDIDSLEFLGFLFKWAVPKFKYCSLTKPEHPSYKGLWLCEVRVNRIRGYGENKDPALALLEAIYKALGGKDE